MNLWKCGDCETTYRSTTNLDKELMDPDDESKGFVSVCECGYRFFKDNWQRTTDVGEYTVSTVYLQMNHGFDGEQLWYETCVFGDDGSRVRDRYRTKTEAKQGHKEIVRELQEETDD